MKKTNFVSSVLAVFFIFTSLQYAFGGDSKHMNPHEFQAQPEEQIKEQVLDLMQKFLSENTNTKQMGADMEIAVKFGIKALPYLLEGVKSETENMRYYSTVTICQIIGHKFIEMGNRERAGRVGGVGRVDVTTLPFSTKDKELLEEFYRLIMLNAQKDKSLKVREISLHTLGLFGRQEAVPTLEKLLIDPEPTVRLQSVSSLSALGHREHSRIKVMTGKEPKTPEEFTEFLGDNQWGLYIEAENQLMKFSKDAVPSLIKVASSDTAQPRQRAIQILGNLKAEEAVPVLTDYLKQETDTETTLTVQISSLYALSKIDTLRSITALEQYGLKHKDYRIVFVAAKLLIPKKREGVVSVLNGLTNDKDPEIRYQAAEVLVENKGKTGIPALISLLNDKKHFRSAKNRLESATGQYLGGIPPIVSQKMIDQYIKKWQDWWEKNQNTFEFQK